MRGKARLIAVTVLGMTLVGTLVGTAVPASADEGAPEGPVARRIASYDVPFKDASGKAAPYPSNCHLAVIISRAGSRIIGDISTMCTVHVEKVYTHGSISRSRFWGWEPVLSQGNTCFAVNYCQVPTSRMTYLCGGTGTHDFRLEGYGYLTNFGTTYTAKAYDQIDEQYCP